MIQAGISDEFFVEGDQWRVAYQFNQRHDADEYGFESSGGGTALGFGVQSGRDSPLFQYGVNRSIARFLKSKKAALFNVRWRPLR